MLKHSVIAVATLMAIGSACAESSVSLYGEIDTGYQFSKEALRIDPNGGPSIRTKTQNAGLVSGVLSESRWGLQGEEELGNGLSAVFNVEAGFDSASGASENGFGFSRRAVVGVKGDFGSVVAGLDRTPLDNWGFDVDGDTKGDVAYAETYSAIFYSGEFSGIGINAMLGRTSTKTSDGIDITDPRETAYGLGLSYSNDAFSVGAALQQFRRRESESANTRTEYGLGASYDFGPVKLFSHYLSSKHTASDGAYSKWEHVNIGVSVPVGDSLTLMAEYGRNRVTAHDDMDRLGDIYGPALGNLNLSAGYRFKGHGNNFMAGANYALSKRTELYARAGRNGSLKVRVYDDTPSSGYLGTFNGHTNYVQLGIRHTF